MKPMTSSAPAWEPNGNLGKSGRKADGAVRSGQATVAKYTSFVEAGKDADFNKPSPQYNGLPRVTVFGRIAGSEAAHAKA